VECLPGEFITVTHPGSRNYKGIEIKGVQVFHDAQGGADRGTNIVFGMTIDHIRVCHLGDLGHVLTTTQAYEIGQVDILMIPVGGNYTIGPEDAHRVVDQLKPKIVLPMHYATDKAKMPIAPVADFIRGREDVVHIDSSEFEIRREQLPDERKIVILKHAL
jgi:L-ascorbate metabolism protein UlaG (beta-lactamase superfamily)